MIIRFEAASMGQQHASASEVSLPYLLSFSDKVLPEAADRASRDHDEIVRSAAIMCFPWGERIRLARLPARLPGKGRADAIAFSGGDSGGNAESGFAAAFAARCPESR